LIVKLLGASLEIIVVIAFPTTETAPRQADFRRLLAAVD
jgi:hypothetical protein